MLEGRLDLRVRTIDGKTFVVCEAGEATVLLNRPEAMAIASALRHLARCAANTESPRQGAVEASPPRRCDVSTRSLHSFHWSIRARRAFLRAGLDTVGDLVTYGPANLLKLRAFGLTTYHEVRDKLREAGLQPEDGLPGPVSPGLRAIAGH